MTGPADNIAVRPAVVGDCAAVASLVDALRCLLGDPTGHLTPEAIARDGFGPDAQFRVIVAEAGSELIGYALYTDAYEPAYAARGVYLADLFVRESERRRGIGRALVDAISADATARGHTFVWWVAQQANTAALDFYRKLEPDFRNSVVAHALVLDRSDRR